jgi:hypothetical protein
MFFRQFGKVEPTLNTITNFSEVPAVPALFLGFTTDLPGGQFVKRGETSTGS